MSKLTPDITILTEINFNVRWPELFNTMYTSEKVIWKATSLVMAGVPEKMNQYTNQGEQRPL